MNVIRNQQFFRARDYGCAYVWEDYRLENCEFHNCRFSTTKDITKRSIARNIELINCSAIDCDIDPAVLEDIYVKDLKVHEIFILWDPLFKHVTLEGKIGTLKINNQITCVDWDPEIQRDFDLAKEAYYKDLDWALNISKAEFTDEFDMRGIPARLVHIDPDTQGIVTRESVSQLGWRERVRQRSEDDLWVFAIDELINSGDEDLVLAAPRGASQKKFQPQLDSLNELKDLGVVLDSI